MATGLPLINFFVTLILLVIVIFFITWILVDRSDALSLGFPWSVVVTNSDIFDTTSYNFFFATGAITEKRIIKIKSSWKNIIGREIRIKNETNGVISLIAGDSTIIFPPTDINAGKSASFVAINLNHFSLVS
jgi:hypothetical protein